MPSAPTAVIAWLERRFRSRSTRAERHELTGENGGPIEVEDPRARLLEKLNTIAARILEQAAEPEPPPAPEDSGAG